MNNKNCGNRTSNVIYDLRRLQFYIVSDDNSYTYAISRQIYGLVCKAKGNNTTDLPIDGNLYAC